MNRRTVLPPDHVLPSAARFMDQFNREPVDEVIAAVGRDAVVVVGMAGNPACGKARKEFESRGIEHTYLQYGGYLSNWRERLPIKQWSGWPLFPQVFVHGVLVGGASRTVEAFESGLIPRMLEAGREDVASVVSAEWERVSRG